MGRLSYRAPNLLIAVLLALNAILTGCQFANPLVEPGTSEISSGLLGAWAGRGMIWSFEKNASGLMSSTLRVNQIQEKYPRGISAGCVRIGSSTYCSVLIPEQGYALVQLELNNPRVLGMRMVDQASLNALEPAATIEKNAKNLITATGPTIKALIASGSIRFKETGLQFVKADADWATAEIASWSNERMKKCDEVAGNEFDPLGTSGRTALEKIPPEAYKICVDALTASLAPHPRYEFLLGRTLLASKRYGEALELLKAAADRGYPMAHYALGAANINAWGTPKNPDAALAYFRTASTLGVIEAETALGDAYSSGLAGRVDEKEALAHYVTAGRKGSVEANAILGERYYFGKGADRDPNKALEYYEKAAPRDLQSQYMVGYINQYYKRNSQAAFENFSKAAADGHAGAQFELGRYYARLDSAEGFREAARWYGASALQGFVRAYSEVGFLYWTGNGLQKNDVEAAQWFRRAADAGNAVGMYWLGEAYTLGRGEPKSINDAKQWFEKAAQAGESRAQYELGVIYLGGSGIPRNDSQAEYWLQKASAQRLSVADYALGYLFERQSNLTQAQVWYRRASQSEYENTKKDALSGLTRIENRLRNAATASSSAGGPKVDSPSAGEKILGLLFLGAIAAAALSDSSGPSESETVKTARKGHYDCPSDRRLVGDQCWPTTDYVSCSFLDLSCKSPIAATWVRD